MTRICKLADQLRHTLWKVCIDYDVKVQFGKSVVSDSVQSLLDMKIQYANMLGRIFTICSHDTCELWLVYKTQYMIIQLWAISMHQTLFEWYSVYLNLDLQMRIFILFCPYWLIRNVKISILKYDVLKPDINKILSLTCCGKSMIHCHNII